MSRLHRTIVEECWRAALARYLYPRWKPASSAKLERYLGSYDFDRDHTGRRLARGRVLAEIVYGARKTEVR